MLGKLLHSVQLATYRKGGGVSAPVRPLYQNQTTSLVSPLGKAPQYEDTPAQETTCVAFEE